MTYLIHIKSALALLKKKLGNNNVNYSNDIRRRRRRRRRQQQQQQQQQQRVVCLHAQALKIWLYQGPILQPSTLTVALQVMP